MMVAMSPGLTVLELLRRQRSTGTWVFVLLLLLVAGERRLAETHLNHQKAEASVERDDVLGADEIRVRLIILNDEAPPTLPDITLGRTVPIAHPIVSLPASVALGSPAPRGPPGAHLLA